MSDLANAPEIPAIAPKGHNLPPVTIERACVECGELFDCRASGPGSNRRFCTDAHKTAFNNRSKAQGQPLLPLLKAWRVARNAKGQSPAAIVDRETGAAAFSEICSILDAMIAEDRAAGRTPASMLDYARESLGSAYTFQDRQSWNAKAKWRNPRD